MARAGAGRDRPDNGLPGLLLQELQYINHLTETSLCICFILQMCRDCKAYTRLSQDTGDLRGVRP